MICPGLYRHHKGGYYFALCVARNSEHIDDRVVCYLSLSKLTFWVRPYDRPLLEGDDTWESKVEWPDGKIRKRFMYSHFNPIIRGILFGLIVGGLIRLAIYMNFFFH